jgi:hypothetical protein
MSPRKVWAATSGDYDWYVNAIFEAEEDAVWSAQHGVGEDRYWSIPDQSYMVRNPDTFTLYGPGETPPGGNPLTLRARIANDDGRVMDLREHIAVQPDWCSGKVTKYMTTDARGGYTDVIVHGPADQDTRDAFDPYVGEVRAEVMQRAQLRAEIRAEVLAEIAREEVK